MIVPSEGRWEQLADAKGIGLVRPECGMRVKLAAVVDASVSDQDPGHLRVAGVGATTLQM